MANQLFTVKGETNPKLNFNHRFQQIAEKVLGYQNYPEANPKDQAAPQKILSYNDFMKNQPPSAPQIFNPQSNHNDQIHNILNKINNFNQLDQKIHEQLSKPPNHSDQLEQQNKSIALPPSAIQKENSSPKLNSSLITPNQLSKYQQQQQHQFNQNQNQIENAYQPNNQSEQQNQQQQQQFGPNNYQLQNQQQPSQQFVPNNYYLNQQYQQFVPNAYQQQYNPYQQNPYNYYQYFPYSNYQQESIDPLEQQLEKEKRRKQKQMQKALHDAFKSQQELINKMVEKVNNRHKERANKEAKFLKHKVKLMENELMLKQFERNQKEFLDKFTTQLEEKLLAIEEARREQDKSIRRAAPNELPFLGLNPLGAIGNQMQNPMLNQLLLDTMESGSTNESNEYLQQQLRQFGLPMSVKNQDRLRQMYSKMALKSFLNPFPMGGPRDPPSMLPNEFQQAEQLQQQQQQQQLQQQNSMNSIPSQFRDQIKEGEKPPKSLHNAILNNLFKDTHPKTDSSNYSHQQQQQQQQQISKTEIDNLIDDALKR